MGLSYSSFRRSHEAVSDAAHCHQMAGMRGIVFDITPQAHDEVVDGARVGVFAQAPHFLQHALAGDGFAFVIDQKAQDAGFHQRERIDLAAGMHFQKIEVNGLLAECEGVFRGLGRARRRCG